MTKSVDRPRDDTIVVNVVHQLMISLAENVADVILDDSSFYPPNENSESVDWAWSKAFATSVQTGDHIAPILLEGRKTSTSYVKSPIRENWHRQVATAIPIRNVVYFAIPLITSYSRLDSLLSRTVFVDIHDVPIGTTKLSVPSKNQYVFGESGSDDSLQLRGPVCYCYDGQHRRLPAEKVHGWIDIREALGECRSGIPLTIDGRSVSAPISNLARTRNGHRSYPGAHHLLTVRFGYRDHPPTEPGWSDELTEWDDRLVTHE